MNKATFSNSFLKRILFILCVVSVSLMSCRKDSSTITVQEQHIKSPKESNHPPHKSIVLYDINNQEQSKQDGQIQRKAFKPNDFEKNLQSIFNSYWQPPLDQNDLVHIALIDKTPKLEFITLNMTDLIIYKNKQAKVIHSPAGTKWQVQIQQQLRPGIIHYIPSVQSQKLFTKPNASLSKHIDKRLFPNANWHKPIFSKRFLLALHPPLTDKQKALNICAKFKKSFNSHETNQAFLHCNIVQKTTQAPIYSAHLKSPNTGFNSYFEGALFALSTNNQYKLKTKHDSHITNGKTHKLYQSFFGAFTIAADHKGDLAFVAQKKRLNYIQSVIPAEIFPNAPIEALKAQSIVTRTYTLQYSSNTTGASPFFICAHAGCQVFKGEFHRQPKTDQAVASTAQQHLQYHDSPIKAYYHAICGGHTDKESDTWQSNQHPYLEAQNDRNTSGQAFCHNNSFMKQDLVQWKKYFNSSKMKSIAIKAGFSNKSPIINIKALQRSTSGRIHKLILQNQSGQKKVITNELRIRQLFSGLRSSAFTIQKHPGQTPSFTLTGKGHGHGSGFCQMGAIGRAEAGQNYQDILKAYFPKAHLSSF